MSDGRFCLFDFSFTEFPRQLRVKRSKFIQSPIDPNNEMMIHVALEFPAYSNNNAQL